MAAVRVAEVDDAVDAQQGGTGAQFVQPGCFNLRRRGVDQAVRGDHDHHPVPLMGQPGERAAGQQRLVVGVGVECQDSAIRSILAFAGI